MAEAVEEPKVDPQPEPKADPQPEPKADAKPEPKADPAPAPKPEAKPDDWRDKRIAELTHKLNEARRAPVAPPVPSAPKADSESQEQFEARVALEAEKRAASMAAVNDWNRQCNDVAAAGKAEFPDFNDRLAACQSVVNGQDVVEVQQFNDFLHAAIETGQAHRLIHALGENPGEVKRLMAASGAKRVVELTRLADKMTAPNGNEEPSGAPKPITPLGSKGLHYDGVKPDDKDHGATLPIGEWMKRREKQVMDQRKAGVTMQ